MTRDLSLETWLFGSVLESGGGVGTMYRHCYLTLTQNFQDAERQNNMGKATGNHPITQYSLEQNDITT